MCVRLHITDFRVFDKCAWSKNCYCSRTNTPPGLDELYERQFTLVTSSDSTSKRTVELKHYPDGPFLLVDCCEFRDTEYYQTRALRKNASGWHAVKTTAFCLMDAEMDISKYNQACTSYAIDEACKRGDVVSPFFSLALSYVNVSTPQLHKFGNLIYLKVPIIRHCFEMYSALCLIMIGCQFSGTRKERTGVEDDYLDMDVVEDVKSAWFRRRPVPRMITNQLTHRLELRIAELDRQILKEVSGILERRERHMWLIGMLALFLLLHIREIDAGRNIFWARYRDEV